MATQSQLAEPEVTAPAELPISTRVRVLLYLGVLVLLIGFGPVYLGLFDVPVSFFLKNQMHLSAPQVAIFRVITGVPLYLSFLWGFARDVWRPFGMRDRGYMVVFSVVTAALYLAFGYIHMTYWTLLIAVVALTSSILFVVGAQSGLTSTIARQHVMSGQVSAVWNIFLSIPTLIVFFVGGALSDRLDKLPLDAAAHQLFLLGAGIAAVIALYALWRPRIVYDNVRAEDSGRSFFGDIGRLLRHKPVYPALLIWLLWNFAPGSVTPLQYYLQNTLHAPNSVYGDWNAIFAGSFIPTFMVFGLLCRRFSLRTLLIWGTVVAVPQMVPLLFLKTIAGSLIGAAACGLMGGVATAAYYDLLIRSCPKGLEGTILMMSVSLYFVASRFGDILGTNLYEHFGGFTICVIAITVVYALILPAIWLVPRALIATPDGVVIEDAAA
jgi:hypothetical protein